MIPLSSAETQVPEADASEEAAPHDEALEVLLARVSAEFGDAVVGSHIRPGQHLWVRVTRDAWRDAARFARFELACEFFDFLSAIDWMPSPFGRDMDSQEDIAVFGKPQRESQPQRSGYAGGDTRFQLFARVYSVSRHHGLIFKTDLPDDDLSADSWVPVYAGANWHERETWEMFGITFNGHPHLRHLYLPSDFEGHPLRKDFPLLSRRIKPWPGIVDVEPMPGEAAGEGGGEDEGSE
ncbi:MAG: NADH-quinone oxidoreductase subunit C [Acidimicrobiales bacterium]|nr:NADH-quinone oxidoreductase subunit C [Acidimicrobiales bacterium]